MKTEKIFSMNQKSYDYTCNNWNTVLPDSNYSLVITNEGLNALTYVLQGGYQLYFSGIKIIDNVIINPNKPVINWTDNDFISAGNVVFTIGTKNTLTRKVTNTIKNTL